MKGITKKLLAVVAVMTVLCMSLTGCGAKLAPADQTVGALFELTAKGNTTPMKDLLGFESDDAVNDAFFEEGANTDLADELKNQLTAAGVEMSDEAVQQFTDSWTSLVNKITYTSEITSEDKDTTVVTLKVNGYSMAELGEIMENAANAMNVTEEDQLAIANGDTELLSSYMQQFFNDFVTGLDGLAVSSEPSEITVTCEKLAVESNGKNIVAWLPSDMSGFCDDVENAMFH